MRAPGRGASQASAGVLCPYIEAHPGSPLLTLGARSLGQWDEFVADLRARVPGQPFDYQRTGTVQVALADAEAAHLTATRDWLRGQGIAAEWLTGASLVECEPGVTPEALGGLLIPLHGFVHVPDLVRALVLATRLAGGRVVTPVDVIHVEQVRDRAVVRMGDSTEEYDVVVVAAGSWSRRVRVAGVPVLPVRPIRGQLLELEAREGELARRSVWSEECYTVPWAGRRLLVGATVEDVGFDEGSTASGVAGLIDAVRRLLPASAAARIADIRVGLRPVTDDHLPLLGPLPDRPRVVVAAGHYRNGILLAPLTAEVVARYVLDGTRDEALAVTDPARVFT